MAENAETSIISRSHILKTCAPLFFIARIKYCCNRKKCFTMHTIGMVIDSFQQGTFYSLHSSVSVSLCRTKFPCSTAQRALEV